MSTISHGPSRAVEEPRWTLQLLVPEMWASLAIVVIWLAVLFAAVYGPNLETTSAGVAHTTLPSAIPIALFAFFATWVVARYGFGPHRKANN